MLLFALYINLLIFDMYKQCRSSSFRSFSCLKSGLVWSLYWAELIVLMTITSFCCLNILFLYVVCVFP